MNFFLHPPILLKDKMFYSSFQQNNSFSALFFYIQLLSQLSLFRISVFQILKIEHFGIE